MIDFKNINFYRDNISILRDINFKLSPGDDCVILGKNGSGKSTLINLIYGYFWPTEGEISIFGNKFGEIPLKVLQKQIGILEPSHQESRLQRNLSVRDIIGTGILSTIGYYGVLSHEQEHYLDFVLSSCTWLNNPSQRFDTLSAGEKKKVLLQRALINKPKLLILDEPCSSLDYPSREDFLNELEKLKNSLNFTILYVTHRVEEILPFFKIGLFLNNGTILKFDHLNQILTDSVISELYDLNLKINTIEGRYSLIPQIIKSQ